MELHHKLLLGIHVGPAYYFDANLKKHQIESNIFNKESFRQEVYMYVDGFVLPVPKKNIKAYRGMSRTAGKVWMDHGAVEYREWIGDDLIHKGVLPFPKAMKVKAGETVISPGLPTNRGLTATRSMPRS